MKFKQRAMTLILSLVMVLTYMPALAFADDEAAEENAQPVAEEVQEEEAPVEEPAPTEEGAPAEEAAPDEEVVPAEEAVPVEEAVPAEEPALVEEPAHVEAPVLVEEASSAEESTSAAKAGEAATATLTFYGNGGRFYLKDEQSGIWGYVDEQILEGQEVGQYPHSQPKQPSRDGYEFLGWSNDVNGEIVEINTIVEGDTSFYAQWEKTPWVTFDPMGGHFDKTNTETGEYEYSYEPVVKYPFKNNDGTYYVYEESPRREGYELLGWTLDKTGGDYVQFQDNSMSGNDIYTIDHDVTLYAQWKKTGYSITLNAGEGAYFDSYEGKRRTLIHEVEFYKEGGTITFTFFDEPYKEGYALSGWKDQDGKTYAYNNETTISIKKDTILTAQYEQACKVTFKPGDGYKFKDRFKDCVIEDYVVYVRKGKALNQNPDFISEDDKKIAAGWKNASGTKVDTQNLIITADTDLYAIWTNRLYVVRDAMEGTFLYPEEKVRTYWVDPGKSLSEYASTFTESGIKVFNLPYDNPSLGDSIFAGWYTDEERSNAFTQSTATQEFMDSLPNQELHLYAGYTDDVYTVTIDPNGGNLNYNSSTKIPKGEAIDPNKYVYKYNENEQRCRIIGWYNSETGEKIELTSDRYYIPSGDVTIYPEWADPLPDFDINVSSHPEKYHFYLDGDFDFYIKVFPESAASAHASDLKYEFRVEVCDTSGGYDDYDTLEPVATLTGSKYYTWNPAGKRLVLHGPAIKTVLDGLSIDKKNIRLRVCASLQSTEGEELDNHRAYIEVRDPYVKYFYNGFVNSETVIAGSYYGIKKAHVGCYKSSITPTEGENEFNYNILSVKVNGVNVAYDSTDSGYYFKVASGKNDVVFTHYVLDPSTGKLTSKIAEEHITVNGITNRYTVSITRSKESILPGETLTLTAYGRHDYTSNGKALTNYKFTYNWKRLEGLDYITITSKVTADDNSWSRVTIKANEGIDASKLKNSDLKSVVSCYLTVDGTRKVTGSIDTWVSRAYSEVILDKSISGYMAVGSSITVTPSVKRHIYSNGKATVTTLSDAVVGWSFDPNVFDIKIGDVAVKDYNSTGKRYKTGTFTIKRKTSAESAWQLTGFEYVKEMGVEDYYYYYQRAGEVGGSVRKMYTFSNPKVYGLEDKVYTGKALYGNVSLWVDNPRGSDRIALQKGIDYKVTYSNNTKVGTATVTITGLKNYNGRKLTRTFKINPKGTTLNTPTAGEGSFTATWKKNAVQTSAYQIRYALNSSFTGAKYKYIKGNTNLKTAVKNLERGKYYYIQVRTCKYLSGKYYYSAWSASKKVKTK